MTASTAFSIGGSGVTPRPIYYGTYSDANSLEITRGNCIPAIQTAPETYGWITVTYTLRDARTSASSIRLYYSIDGGTTFSSCAESFDTLSDGETGLTTSVSGVTHMFSWNSYGDLGNDYVGDVIIKIRAYDRDNYIGDYVDSQNFNIYLNNAPLAPSLITPTDGYFQKDDTPIFVGTIPEDNNPMGMYSKVHVRLEIDTSESFNSNDLVIFESRVDQTGWEYKNVSDNWEAIPINGLQMRPDIVGNYVRFVVPTEDRLDREKLYWRIVFGGVTDESAATFINAGFVLIPQTVGGG